MIKITQKTKYPKSVLTTSKKSMWKCSPRDSRVSIPGCLLLVDRASSFLECSPRYVCHRNCCLWITVCKIEGLFLANLNDCVCLINTNKSIYCVQNRQAGWEHSEEKMNTPAECSKRANQGTGPSLKPGTLHKVWCSQPGHSFWTS